MLRGKLVSYPVVIAALLLLCLSGASAWLRAQLTDTRPISELVPPGALLYLEAKDFHALLNEWDNSDVKSRWLKTANYSVLAESRLIQRLSQAQDEFEQVAGIAIGMRFLNQTAGTRSAFALYNFSALRFVYLSQMSPNHLDNVQLWRDRTKYTRREVSGIAFYLKGNDDGTRTVAFAGYKDWFLVATDENLAAETLVLLSGRKDVSVATEAWFQSATKEASVPGDLRLVYNLTALIATPQFRTYWLQRNATELKPFSAGISDLFRQGDGWKEERAMIRKSEVAVGSGDESLREALTYAPSSDSLYRAWSMPERDKLTDVLQSLIAPEQPKPAVFEPPAPDVTAAAAEVGSEAELEIRIDEPPFQRSSKLSVVPVVDAILAMQPTALLQVQTTRALRDQVFVLPGSGVVIVCKQPDRDALDRALAQVRGPLGHGLLDALHVSANANTIVLSRLNLTRAPSGSMTFPAKTRYVAVYNHAAEWPHYRKLFGVVDRTPNGPEATLTPNRPPFFSGNLESIGDSLPRLQKASIISVDNGAVVHETVKYDFERP